MVKRILRWTRRDPPRCAANEAIQSTPLSGWSRPIAANQAPAWNGLPSDAGAFSRIVVALREMTASTAVVAR
jgi:hypothetical protein